MASKRWNRKRHKSEKQKCYRTWTHLEDSSVRHLTFAVSRPASGAGADPLDQAVMGFPTSCKHPSHTKVSDRTSPGATSSISPMRATGILLYKLMFRNSKTGQNRITRQEKQQPTALRCDATDLSNKPLAYRLGRMAAIQIGWPETACGRTEIPRPRCLCGGVLNRR